MSNKIGLVLVFLSIACFGKSLDTLLEHASPGEYVVFESRKIITLVLIHSMTANTIVFEEISLPSKQISSIHSWKEWVQQKAPGHTSWSMTEMQRDVGKIVRSYSFSRHAYLPLSSGESFIATLLQRPLTPVPLPERRKIGAAPSEGEQDYRKIWEPNLIFEGAKIPNPAFEVLQTFWPEDGSICSGEKIVLYFDSDQRTSFPYWIEIQTSHAALQIQIIDSGIDLYSTRRFPSENRHEGYRQELQKQEENQNSKTTLLPIKESTP